MKRVILESRYAPGDGLTTDDNLEYLGRCVRDCLRRGEAPIASHGLFTRWLDDESWGERTLGVLAGHAWIPAASAMVVYIDNGISAGMLQGVERANAAGLAVEYRRLEDGDE